MEYQVDLEVFRGPLDLLLYLVKRDEVDVREISIARVAAQFLEYLRVLELVDVERAGDFLVMAATLMEIKSRMLLPRAIDGEEEEDDPRQELVRQLMEYKKYKDAAADLEALAEVQATRLARQGTVGASHVDLASQPLRTVELWDLVSAFGRLMRETMALQPQQIVVDQTPIQHYMEQILHQLRRASPMPFKAFFQPPRTRARLIGIFLALLELIKGRLIAVDQPEAFGGIQISLARPMEGLLEPTPAP